MKITKYICLSLVLALLAASCGKNSAPETTAAPETTQTEQTSETEASAEETTVAEEITAAEETATEPETTAEPETEPAEAELIPVSYELSDYIREYPGTDGSELKFVADAQILRITSDGYDALQGALDEYNTFWKTQADDAFASQAQEFASGDINEYLQGLLPFSYHQGITVSRADSAVFSFYKSSDSWYGGAHPFAYQIGANFDSVTGKALGLEDVVTDYDAFYEEVQRTLEEYEDSDYFFDDWKDTLKAEFYDDPEQQVNWVLTKDGISVWFNQYEIAPYAAGPVYLDFPVKEYVDLFKAEYFTGEIPEVETDEGETSVYVRDLCRETDSYEDSVGNTYFYSYRLPEIIGPDTDYLREVNAGIGELKAKYVDSELESMKDGVSLTVFDTGYSSVNWNGITSVIARIYMESDYEMYRCWNLHQDGTKAENAEILELFGFTPESFTEAALAAVEPTVDFDPEWFGEEMGTQFQYIREQTLSPENINADIPIYITADRALGFVCPVYSMAGAEYYETCFEIPGTEHRPDGLTKVSVNPQSADNITLKGSCYEIRDNDSREVYRFDGSTVLIGGLPCYDDGCDPMTWMQRYLDHPAYGEMTDDPYSISGFAMGDILTMLVDEDGHVSVLQSVSYWD